ncbi:hypothetical protein KFE96_07455 [Kordiimonas sp. SCSIO 12603]|uniref:hypothetical protein n=1 Tax=Kordiimonas sp. SCSIO 12603 TaxID=2829596 RepID=UPI002102354C|nr:hypothetical protein [Kordiimonas sp. SCSIO 12603]UTW60138.1 hypothetical protein KFE96_07455 [Kordiimonas sp. SCSIO 12603]
MKTQAIQNPMFRSKYGPIPSHFVWWKRGAILVFVALPISSFILGVLLSRPDMEINPYSFWMILFYSLFALAIILPFIAPKEVRLIGSDTLLQSESRKKQKLFVNNFFANREAELVLDEREQLLRLKAYAFAYKMAIMLAIVGFGSIATKLDGSINSISIAKSLLIYLALINLCPSAYLVWNHKPLRMFDDEDTENEIEYSTIQSQEVQDHLKTIKKRTSIKIAALFIALPSYLLFAQVNFLVLMFILSGIAAVYSAYRLQFAVPALFQMLQLPAAQEALFRESFKKARIIGLTILALTGALLAYLKLDIEQLTLGNGDYGAILIALVILYGLYTAITDYFVAFRIEAFLKKD